MVGYIVYTNTRSRAICDVYYNNIYYIYIYIIITIYIVVEDLITD
jgi:hypothetical protein